MMEFSYPETTGLITSFNVNPILKFVSYCQFESVQMFSISIYVIRFSDFSLIFLHLLEHYE